MRRRDLKLNQRSRDRKSKVLISQKSIVTVIITGNIGLTLFITVLNQTVVVMRHQKQIIALSFDQVLWQLQLEIWGKAQHQSARRPKSDWGKNLRVVKFPRWQSHVARTQMH